MGLRTTPPQVIHAFETGYTDLSASGPEQCLFLVILKGVDLENAGCVWWGLPHKEHPTMPYHRSAETNHDQQEKTKHAGA